MPVPEIRGASEPTGRVIAIPICRAVASFIYVLRRRNYGLLASTTNRLGMIMFNVPSMMGFSLSFVMEDKFCVEARLGVPVLFALDISDLRNTASVALITPGILRRTVV